MADMNFMDVFFGSGLSIPTSTEESKRGDDKNDNDYLEWISDEFLDSILKSCSENSNPPADQFFNRETRDIDSFMECSSDSGISRGSVVSPSNSIRAENDLWLNDTLLEDDNLIQKPEGQDTPRHEQIDHSSIPEIMNSSELIKEEEIECEEVAFDTVYVISSDSTSMDNVKDTTNVTCTIDSNDLCMSTFSSDNSSVERYKENGNQVSNIKQYKLSKVHNYSYIQRLQNKRKFSDISEGTASDDSDCKYPCLQLTSEEQKLAANEGIKLPIHYPLTKTQERELKRIRRKIRNKISAQDSRRRKKEYVDGLEERVRQTVEENAKLLNRIKALENQRLSLVTQVKKLQASLARRYSSQSTTQSSISLIVLLLSLALVLAPSTRNLSQSSESTKDEGISLSEDTSTPLSTGRLRNLLFSQQSPEVLFNLDDDAGFLEQLQKTQQLPTDSLTMKSVVQVLKTAKMDSLFKDHDYFRPRKRTVSEKEDQQSCWTTSKMVAQMVSQLKTISDNFGRNNNQAKQPQKTHSIEPVVIDLCD